MKEPKLARQMLILAQRDLKAAQNMMDADKFDDAIFGFHAQQVVEKALKAILSLHGIEYKKTHDIRILFRLLEMGQKPVEGKFYELADLTDFAVEFHYDILDYEALDRIAILKKVNSFVEYTAYIVNNAGI